MRVLVACEFSGTVRRAFRARGHDAWSCDLLDAEDGGEHIKADAFDAINCGPRLAASRYPWDLMIAHPPCTYVCGSGIHWNRRRPERAAQTEEAVHFFIRLLDCGIPKIAIENPIGILSTRVRKPDQIIQPFEFGEDASKKTCLWLVGLSQLRIDPARRHAGRWVTCNGRRVERWGNQTDSGQNKLPPSETRWADRSLTYSGIARAMAAQWGTPEKQLAF